MRTGRVELSIHRDEHIQRLERLAARFLAGSNTVCVDFALLTEATPTGFSRCHHVGRGGPQRGIVKRLADAVNASYPAYYTCLASSPAEVMAAAKAARLSSEFRIRVFRQPPSDNSLLAWSTERFWDPDAQHPEEGGAIVVATARDDGTSFSVMADDSVFDDILDALGRAPTVTSS